MNTQTIARHATGRGFAIGIIKQTAQNGSTFHSVIRINAQNKYITISNHSTEVDARAAANKEWSLDRG